MTSPASRLTQNTDFDFPVACLDAQDFSIVPPFREFLETHGCVVVSNRQSAIAASYQIIIGSYEYVKTIFEKNGKLVDHPFVLLYDSDKTKADDLVASHSVKVAIIQAKQYSPREAERIFAYFFVGSEMVQSFTSETDAPLDALARTTQGEADIYRKNFSSSGERIDHLIQEVYGEDERARAVETSKKTKKRYTTLRKIMHNLFAFRIPWNFLITLFIVVLAPLVWYGIMVGAATLGISSSESLIRRGAIADTNRPIALASVSLTQAELTLGLYKTPLALVGQQGIIRGQERLLSLLRDVLTSETSAIYLVSESKLVGGALFSLRSDPEEHLAVELERLKNHIAVTMGTVGLAQAELGVLLSEAPFPFGLGSVRKVALEVRDRFTSLHKSLGQLTNLLTLYPVISGFDQSKTYLVIFQNSMELRPTGGFIGSVATATARDGRIGTLEIQDVYALDGQLKGHVDPPGPIAQLLGQEHWYLRDSNWDPDFRKSSERAAWFYEKESGVKPDGVIAISTPFLIDLLRVTGPVELPDINDRITADNFFGKSIFYTRADFFPGSTQKKDFLGILATAILEKITTMNGIDPTALFRAMTDALERGDILLSFSDRGAQSLVERYGWAGALPTRTLCDEENDTACFPEQIVAIEANMSVNKANYFVTRSESIDTTISPTGEVTTDVTILYQNSSPNDHPASGGGTYKTYLRFLLPQDAATEGITLNGRPIPVRSDKQRTTRTAQAPLPYAEVYTTDEGSVVGIAFVVESGDSQLLAFSFRRGKPFRLSEKGDGVYEMNIFRQPGLLGTTLTARVHYPEQWIASPETQSNAAASLVANPGEVRYNTALTKTTALRVHFITSP